ncbi:MAG: hypothetical protein KF841_00040 [Phycisphaerae bacterium]|nr:hypothetical protein [Phycisphaerae bacterium]
MALGAAFAWLVPGLGHWWIGERKRAVIFFVTITSTFWCGIAVGGVRSAITPRDNGLWIAAQICAGPQAIGALYASKRIEANAGSATANSFKAPWPAGDIGVVYSGVAGLLNLLVILDTLSRADRAKASLAAQTPLKRS